MRKIDRNKRAFGFSKKRNATLKNKSKKKIKKRPSLKDYFERVRPLKGKYKGKTYKAKLFKSGKIKYKGKSYDTPSATARVALKRRAPRRPNGWHFWSVKDHKNQWIKLSKLN